MLDGVSYVAVSLAACRCACVDNLKCTGVDWNPTASPAGRCSLTGPWSSRWKVGIVPIYYNLTRNPGCGEVHSGKTLRPILTADV